MFIFWFIRLLFINRINTIPSTIPKSVSIPFLNTLNTILNCFICSTSSLLLFQNVCSIHYYIPSNLQLWNQQSFTFWYNSSIIIPSSFKLFHKSLNLYHSSILFLIYYNYWNHYFPQLIQIIYQILNNSSSVKSLFLENTIPKTRLFLKTVLSLKQYYSSKYYSSIQYIFQNNYSLKYYP